MNINNHAYEADIISLKDSIVLEIIACLCSFSNVFPKTQIYENNIHMNFRN